MGCGGDCTWILGLPGFRVERTEGDDAWTSRCVCGSNAADADTCSGCLEGNSPSRSISGRRCDRKGCTLFAMTPKTTVRPGRNEPCHCGSGRKYKLCCLEKDNAALTAANAKVGAEAAARPAEAVRPAAKRRTKHQTEQPWKASTSHVFVPRPRGPRKVGGS